MTGVTDSFAIFDGALVQAITPRRGHPYTRACERATFIEVLHAFDSGDPLSGVDLVERIGLPHTQIFTALAFLKERGVVIPARRKKSVRASTDAYLDGMTEWSALEESC